MIVVPESMIVSNPLLAIFDPTTAFAPVACQNPVDVSIWWNSISPLYRSGLVPPRNSSEPDDASLKPNTPEETTPSSIALLNHGFYEERERRQHTRPLHPRLVITSKRRTWLRFEIAGQARPRMPSIGSSLNVLDSVVTGAKYCPETFRPATATV